MSRLANLIIHQNEFSFSAGHFTIFSATQREQLHGHNYQVSVAFEMEIKVNGLSFDYRHYKQKIHDLCEKIDRHFLLPTQSPYLSLTENEEYYFAEFNHKKIPFLKEDVVLLPLCNITIEELSNWFLQQLLEFKNELIQHNIQTLTVNVYNGPGQSGGATWRRENA